MSRADEELVYKALADTRRRKMLDLLREEPWTTGDLCGEFPELNRCTVMQHLGVLESAGLVIVRREGRHRWNYLDPTPIRRIHDRWISRYTEHSVEVLARLKSDLEDGS